ncbi:MAG: DUF1232 domain-containing protein [Alphaproteobacteria bacterium]|nr:DUF1232 domain-containing protein [Alphaproteobacteria bacterium]
MTAERDPDPGKLARDRATVRRGFWPKAKRTLGQVPFLDQALAAYYCAVDRRTPAYVKAILLGAIAYFVMPADVIPDFIAGLGYTDDASVLVAAITAVKRHLTTDHRARAAQALERLRAE